MYRVLLPGKVSRSVEKLPRPTQQRLANLIEDLRNEGPIQLGWPNYGRLSAGRYHCHLSYRWVACWYHAKGTLVIEVYYVGSRENAPY